MKRLISLLLVTFGCMASAPPAAAQAAGYTVTDLGVLTGATATTATAINDSGLVVGICDIPQKDRTITRTGWRWTPSTADSTQGTMDPLAPLDGWRHSYLWDVSNSGLAVGTSSATGTPKTATFWEAPGYKPQDFNTLPRDASLAGWSFVNATLVSDSADAAGAVYVAGLGHYAAPGEATFEGGIIWRISAGGIDRVVKLDGFDGAGGYGDLNGYGQVADAVQVFDSLGIALGFDAFLWDHTGLWDRTSGGGTRLGALGRSSFAKGINDYGTIVGNANTPAGGRGFVWTPEVRNGTQGTITTLDTLGGTLSYADGIYSPNQIVGSAYLKGDRTKHACLWLNGATTPTDLNSLKTAGATGLELTQAFMINSNGRIVGEFVGNKGRRAFLLTPR